MGKPKQVAKSLPSLRKNLQPYFEPCEVGDKISYKCKLGQCKKNGERQIITYDSSRGWYNLERHLVRYVWA
jgi:hypothetical protein